METHNFSYLPQSFWLLTIFGLSSAATYSSYSSVKSLSNSIMTISYSSTPNLSKICTSEPLSNLYVIQGIDWSSPLFFKNLQILQVASSLLSLNFIYPFSISTKAHLVEMIVLPLMMGPQSKPHNKE